MTEIPDETDDPRISERLHDVLTLIMCPIAGCWSLHGAETMIYYDEDADAYVLEAWPVRVKPPEDPEGTRQELEPQRATSPNRPSRGALQCPYRKLQEGFH
jgi:hypothetical protein